MYAGIFIGIAAVLYVRCDNPLIGAVLFSVGLLSCLLYQVPLCTGQANKPWHALIDKRYPICKQYRVIAWTRWMELFAVNGFFALWVGAMAYLCIDVSRANDIVLAKISHPWYWILFMGFLCGMLIQCAVHAWQSDKGGWPIVVLCVTGFLMLGGEHCIADAAFVGMAGLHGMDVALGCVKLVTVSALGNLLAGALFYNIGD